MFQQLSLEAALYIVRNMRDSDRDCLNSIIGQFGIETFALNRYQANGAAWAYFQDGEPVVMGGIAEATPWLGVGWMISTDGVSADSWKKIIRFGRKIFMNAKYHYSRIDAQVISTWPQAIKYVQKIGFEPEGVKKRAGREGQDILEFVILGEKNNA